MIQLNLTLRLLTSQSLMSMTILLPLYDPPTMPPSRRARAWVCLCWWSLPWTQIMWAHVISLL